MQNQLLCVATAQANTPQSTNSDKIMLQSSPHTGDTWSMQIAISRSVNKL